MLPPAEPLELSTAFQKVGIALGLGLLVGMQRERAKSRLAGIRTFALLTVLGAVSGLLAQHLGGWVVAAGLVAVSLLLVVGNLGKIAAGNDASGLTTEMAVLLMYGVGAYVVLGHTPLAIAMGGAVAVLLHLKDTLHRLVARIGEEDVRAIMQFALIALVILPVLPDQTYGPFDVLNPRQIWMMVVLIVGMSLGGYVAFKLVGQQAGTVLAGLLGGLISSTATTVGHARRTKEAPDGVAAAALIIMIASTMAFGRVLAEIAVVAPGFLATAWPPLAVMLGWMALLAGALWFWARGESDHAPEPKNPAELKPALIFGAIYAGVLLAVAAAKDYLGDRGLYVVALISGLTDMDAITLSTSRLVEQERLEGDTAWRVILLAALANLVFKGGTAVVLGHRRLGLWVGAAFAAATVGGLLLLFLWPTPVAPG